MQFSDISSKLEISDISHVDMFGSHFLYRDPCFYCKTIKRKYVDNAPPALNPYLATNSGQCDSTS